MVCAGAQFTGFTGTKVQMLTRKALPAQQDAADSGSEGSKCAPAQMQLLSAKKKYFRGPVKRCVKGTAAAAQQQRSSSAAAAQ